MKRFKSFVICIALLLPTHAVAAEPFKFWIQLTPLQQEAMMPIATQWDSLPVKLQKNLLSASKHYPELTVNQQRLFQSRLEKWSRLTPQQRERAREKFLAFKKIKQEIRSQVKQMVIEQNANHSPESAVASSAIEH